MSRHAFVHCSLDAAARVSPLSPPLQPPIILYLLAERASNMATHFFYFVNAPPRICAPASKEGEMGVAAVRQHLQHEVKGNKNTLKHIVCVGPPPLFRPLIVWYCDLNQSISCIMFRCLEQ